MHDTGNSYFDIVCIVMEPTYHHLAMDYLQNLEDMVALYRHSDTRIVAGMRT